jgi:hypothetical protein
MACILFAGTTGKIAGKILDKETGEPLIGVNVIVKGTSLGSATDIDGYFSILYIPPGVHTVIASMVGYSAVTVDEVRVLIDQTAPVDITMTPQAIETGVVVVIAERSIVKKDVSTSVAAVQPEEIQSLPVTSIDQVVGLQAGVEDGMVIRGGDANQLLLQIDGVTMRDPRNNKPISTVSLSSIQEISIERGGFNAEYGQVRSGIINIVSKEADVAHYTGTIEVNYTPPQQKYFGMSVYDPNSMWNRPYLDPEVCWTGTDYFEPFTDLNNNHIWDSGESFNDLNGDGKHQGWDEYIRRQYPKFDGGWNGISKSRSTDTDPYNDLSPAALQRVYEWQHRRRPNTNAPDYNIDGSFGGPIPIIGEALGNLRFFTSFRMVREMLLIPLSRDDYQDYNWSIKLNSDISKSMKLTLTGKTGKSYNVAINLADAGYYNTNFGINGITYWNPTDYVRTPLEIAAITNEQRSCRIFTDSWYCTANVSDYALAAKLVSFMTGSTYYEISIENLHREYLTEPIRARDTTKRYEVVPGYFVDEAPFGYSNSLEAGIGDGNLFFGGHSATARDASKLNSFVLKGDLTSQLNKEHLLKAGIEFSYYDLNLDYGVHWVTPTFSQISLTKETYNPYRISAYVQDKIEAYGFIANIGLRMDLSNPNTDWVDVDYFNKAFYSNNYDPNINYPKTKVKPDISLSPRLGISHPITEGSKLYFNYGHFKQMPAYEEIFRISRGPTGNRTMYNYGNPNLVQAQTVTYELGFDQSLFDTYLIQIAAFYNDITDQQAYTTYSSDRNKINYDVANNNSYSDIRGFELTLRKTLGDWVRGFANYTYQVVTQGQFGKLRIDESPSQQKIYDQQLTTNALYRQKPIPQPRANASIMFLLPKDLGSTLFSIRTLDWFLGDWTLNVLGTWKAGQWLTYPTDNPYSIINNVQVTDYYNIDFRLNKTLDFKTITVTLFMDVRNLLNTKRLSGESFYNNEDYLLYMGSLHLPKSIAYENKNVVGDDRVGDYRKEGVPYQPIEFKAKINPTEVGTSGVIYWEKDRGTYWEYVNNPNIPIYQRWKLVDQDKIDQILADKAYIDMPNNTSFNFLNPRTFSYGINISFKL